MKTYSKRILLLPLAVVFIALLASGVSAAITFNTPSTVTKSTEVDSKLIAYVDQAFTYQFNATPDTGSQIASFAIVNAGGLTDLQISNSGSAGTLTFTPKEEDIGLHTVTISATESGSVNATQNQDITLFVTKACAMAGELKVTSVDVTVNDLTGDDETNPGDSLDISFTLDTSFSLSNVKATAWLEKSDGTRVGSKVMTEKDDLDDDSRDEEITLRVDPTAKQGQHVLIIEATGTDSDTDNDVCYIYEEKRAEENVQRESHSLLIDTVTVEPAQAACGEKLQITSLIYNIGDETEDAVKLRIRNAELNIDQYSELFKMQKSGSSAKVTKAMAVDIPAGAKGTYLFDVLAYYNSGSDTYATSIGVPVVCKTAGTTTTETGTAGTAGTGTISIPTTAVTAESGQTAKFTAAITNTGSAAQTYDVSVSGVSDWATSSIEPSSVAIASGASSPVYVYLTPKSGVYGDQTATVTVKSSSTVLATKTLTVTLPQKPATTVTPKSSTAAPQLQLSDEAMVAVTVIVVLIVVGFLYRSYISKRGVKIYGVKKGRKGEEL